MLEAGPKNPAFCMEATMKIKMIHTFGKYIKDNTYTAPGDLTENHAKIYVKHGYAVEIKPGRKKG